MAIADLSPHCFHVIHAKCLKQQQQQASSDKASSKTCPVCDKSIHVWSVSKQAAQFAAFWMARVETCLQTLKPPTDEHGAVRPLPAYELRDRLHKDKTLTETQKRYIDETKGGLLGALEWGGGIDHNTSFIGHLGWSKCLRTKGILEAKCVQKSTASKFPLPPKGFSKQSASKISCFQIPPASQLVTSKTRLPKLASINGPSE